MRFIHTADLRMKKLLEMADQVASSRACVLITGESGTGKELLARYIHAKSHRSDKPFVAINSAAVPEGLLESELFGFEKGAFTGADKSKAGKFEIANRGTFMLDEISELPILLQSKLLRVLQEGEIERVGGLKPQKVDIRFVAATNQDLSRLVETGAFREDLFYRLNVIPLKIPALRERPRDIELLSQTFLDAACESNSLGEIKLSEEAMKKLMSWTWPGNIRELQNVIERSALMCGNSTLSAEQILIDGFEEKQATGELRAGMTVSEAERRLILKTLEFTEQNRTQAAQMLGISIRTLRNKLHEYRREHFINE